MKKDIILYLISVIAILSLGIIAIFVLTNKNEFSYEEAKTAAEKNLNENEEYLTKLVNELYASKESTKDLTKGVSYASYENNDDFNFKNKIEYIKIDLDSQGVLGGQYYGLIYTKESKENLIIYDEKKTKKGNNVFIRKKIKDNWYFYYEDYDGKINTNNIK